MGFFDFFRKGLNPREFVEEKNPPPVLPETLKPNEKLIREMLSSMEDNPEEALVFYSDVQTLNATVEAEAEIKNTKLMKILSLMVAGESDLEWVFIEKFMKSLLFLPVKNRKNFSYLLMSLKPPLEGHVLPVFSHKKPAMDFFKNGANISPLLEVKRLFGTQVFSVVLENNLPATVFNPAGPAYYEFNEDSVRAALKGLWFSGRNFTPEWVTSDFQRKNQFFQGLLDSDLFYPTTEAGEWLCLFLPDFGTLLPVFTRIDRYNVSRVRFSKSRKDSGRRIVRKMLEGDPVHLFVNPNDESLVVKFNDLKNWVDPTTG